MVLLDQTTELRKITCLCIHRVPQLSHSRSISRLMHVLLSQTVHSHACSNLAGGGVVNRLTIWTSTKILIFIVIISFNEITTLVVKVLPQS